MRFIVYLKIDPATPKEEIAKLLPAERARVAELKEQGILKMNVRTYHWLKSKSCGRLRFKDIVYR
ncbi:hypothetical protein E2R58_09150 [Paenibacillus amylolyticus]|uniref:hypothetical protein n=1 Tax=Paenibacillus amylolyticus TaxID=1451 RepID=UPI001059B436|nr:hypothetical protein [Paenibacillus amylolyticus]TDL69326.1 hypothetical protein E2R58_09150 [Paenibacillus amylolyticus]